MTHVSRTKRMFLCLLLLPAFLAAGCFGKGGGSSTASAPAAVSNLSAGNIVPGSVATNKAPDGSVTVTWKTQSPSMGNHVLAGTLKFEGRTLYDQVIKEQATAPTTEHVAVIPAANAELGVAVTDGLQNLDDNGGFGYVVK